MEGLFEDAMPGFPKDPKIGARMAGNGRTWRWCAPGGKPVSAANNPRRVGTRATVAW